MSASRPARLALFAFAGLAACTEATPIDLTPDDDVGATADPTPQPAFTPFVPPAETTATGGGNVTGATAGQAGPGSGGSAAAGKGGAGGQGGGTGGAAGAGLPPPAGNLTLIPEIVPVAFNDAGTFVVGRRQTQAVAWTAAGGVVPLPLAAPYDGSVATAMDSSGAVVVGSWRAQGTSEAVTWSFMAPGLMNPAAPGPIAVRFGFLPGHDSSEAIAVSADSKVVAGTSRNTGAVVHAGERAFVSKQGPLRASLQAIEPLAGDTASEAVVLSRDGSTLAGYSYAFATKRQRAFWWREGAPAVEIAAVNGATSMVPRAMSADGSVLVGDADFGATKRLFRWTRAGGAVLDPQPRNRDSSRVVGVSADGATIVGLELSETGQWKDLPVPFRWLTASNMVQNFVPGDLPVPTVFTDERGSTIVGLGAGSFSTGYFFWHDPATAYTAAPHAPLPVGSEGVALSRNGRVLLGQGRSADDHPVAWLMLVP